MHRRPRRDGSLEALGAVKALQRRRGRYHVAGDARLGGSHEQLAERLPRVGVYGGGVDEEGVVRVVGWCRLSEFETNGLKKVCSTTFK